MAIAIGISALVLPLAAASVPASAPGSVPVARRGGHRAPGTSGAPAAGAPSGAGQAVAVSVRGAPSTVALRSGRPAVGPRSALLVIATVIALVPPAGTVGFTDGRSAIPECRRVPLSSSAPYVARCQVLPSAARGALTESIVGSYSGSLQVAPSVSAPLTVLAATGDRPSG